jgi:hypothetical protein
MARKKPIISPLGQWAYPGEVTIIPSSDITMKGVNYPVLGVDNLGNSQMMMPGQDYTFPGDYVTEIPQMGKGGLAQWFDEKWVDVKTGKACGRSGKDKDGRPYPACRPSKRVNETTPKTTSEMSSAEKAKFKREKTSGKRIDYNHKRRQDGGEWLDDEPEVNPKIGWNSGNRYSYDKKGNLIYTNHPLSFDYDVEQFIEHAINNKSGWLGNSLNDYEIDFLKNAKNKIQNLDVWPTSLEFQVQTQVDKLNPSLDELINVTQNIYPDQYAIDNSFSKASKSRIDLPTSAFENDIKERYVIPEILKNSINKRFGTLPTTRDDSYSPNRIWTTKVKNDEDSNVGARFATDEDNSKYAYILTPNSKKASDLSKEKINTKKENIENLLSSADNKFYENLYLKYPDYIQYPGNYNNPEIGLFGDIKNILPNQMWNRAEQMRVEMLNNPEIKDWADLHNVNLSRGNEDSKQNLVIDGFAPKVPESAYANRLVKAGLPVSTPDYSYGADDTYIVQDPSKFNLAGYFPIPKDYDEENAKQLIAKKLGIKPEQLNNKDYLIHYNKTPITEYTPGKKYGGWLEEYQVGGVRRPIYTSNPRDPRIGSYRDSLNLYNSGEDYYSRLKKSSFDSPNIGVSEEDLKKARDENYKKYPWDKLKMPVSNEKSGKKFQPVSKYNIYVSDVGNIESNRYKKPVQPYIYKKPEVSPIYTSDLNDPRLRSYNDSLSLYNKGKSYLNQPYSNNLYNYAQDLLQFGDSRKIAPGKSKKGISDLMIPQYKKPVQPYIYKKPEVIPEVIETPVAPAPVVEPPKPSLFVSNIDRDMYTPGGGMAREYNIGVTLQDGNRKSFRTEKEFQDWKAANNLDISKAKVTEGRGYSYDYPENKKYGGWLNQYQTAGEVSPKSIGAYTNQFNEEISGLKDWYEANRKRIGEIVPEAYLTYDQKSYPKPYGPEADPMNYNFSANKDSYNNKLIPGVKSLYDPITDTQTERYFPPVFPFNFPKLDFRFNGNESLSTLEQGIANYFNYEVPPDYDRFAVTKFYDANPPYVANWKGKQNINISNEPINVDRFTAKNDPSTILSHETSHYLNQNNPEVFLFNRTKLAEMGITDTKGFKDYYGDGVMTEPSNTIDGGTKIFDGLGKDRKEDELLSDAYALKQDMRKKGFYDYTKGEKLTPEIWNKYKKEYPDNFIINRFIPVFEEQGQNNIEKLYNTHFPPLILNDDYNITDPFSPHLKNTKETPTFKTSDERIIHLLNEIVKNKDQNLNIAKYGGWLNKYQPGGGTEQNPERMQGVEIFKKRSWLDKLRGYVHKGEKAIGLDPYNERSDDFMEQWARRINTATGGKDWYKQPNDASGTGGIGTAMMETVMAPFSAPQLASVYGATGKVQMPSEAMNIQNPVGSFLADAILDPTNLVGAGIAKNLGKGSLQNMIRNRSRGVRPDFTPNVSNQLAPPPSEIIVDPTTGQFNSYFNQDMERPYFDEWVRMMNNNASELDVSNLFANPAESIDLIKLKKIAKNRSGLTKEEILKNASPKDKEVLSKMSESEFEQTVLKPTGEVVPYEPAVNLGLGFNTNTRNLNLSDVIPMDNSEYVDIFNSRLDRLNEIISRNNKSGLDYSVKGLSPSGALTFNTPAQIEKLAPDTAVLNQLRNRGFMDEAGNIDPRFQDYADRWGITGNRNIPQGESTWMLDINPGQWRGEVEDIANAEYFKAIPGLNMRNTTASVFSDALPRRGTGTYNSINEYLKELDLGRVKPGFNSQSQSSSGLWEDAIKKGKAFGYFNNPGTVYGSMRTVAPLVAGAAAASQLQEQKKGGQTSWLNKYK